MSATEAATEIAEIAADGVADGMHIVGEEALAIEKVAQGFDAMNLAYLGLGLAFGAAIGGFIGFKAAYAKAEAKHTAIAEEEIAEMQEHYAAKRIALENDKDKASLEAIVREKGYRPSEGSATPPMAITPPSAVTERAQEMADSDDAKANEQPSAEEEPPAEVRSIWENQSPPVEDEWDWHRERAARTPMAPFIIHIDERDDDTPYDSETYTFYEADDVVCNERDEPMDAEERERVIGEENLEKFGHGSGDANIVYVRNPVLEMDMEIIRSPNSFVEEVHGFEPEIKHSDRHRERRSIEDE